MIYFIGAGPGDAELITLKGYRLLQKADAVLYTGSLVPKELLTYCKEGAIIKDSQSMKYDEIFEFLKKYSKGVCIRLHTGDTTIYSTIAKQIAYLKSQNIEYEVIPGVTAAFAGAASAGIEYTIPGVSQTLVISRVEGKTPNPEPLENILALKHSSLVFYLSITLIDKLVSKAKEMGYSNDTPCWVVERASWKQEQIYKGTISDISSKVSHIKGVALIMLGKFLEQEELVESHLYSKAWR